MQNGKNWLVPLFSSLTMMEIYALCLVFLILLLSLVPFYSSLHLFFFFNFASLLPDSMGFWKEL